MKTTRQFETIYILLHKKKVSAKELAEHFGVSTRTIYRDIDALSVAGIPIYAEQGKGGGIRLLPDFVLDKSLLSEQEQNEILTALHGLALIKAGDADAGDVLGRLSTIFNKSAINWLKVDFSGWGYSDNYFNDFKTAIIEHSVVEFDYYNRYSQKSFRRVEPVQLWFKLHSWYIRGYCLTKQAPRLYKLTRVQNLLVTDETFEERDWSLILKEDDESESTVHEMSIVKLRIAPEMTYRVFDDFDENRIKRQADGSYIVTAHWGIDNWVCGYVLSFGEYVEVLEPAELKATIAEKIKKMSKRFL